MSKPTTAATSLLSTLTDAFGEHPDDVLLEMRIAADTLEEIEALFAAIKGALEKTEHRDSYAARLASLGAYLAADRSSLIHCAREKFRDCLLSHGIDCGGMQ